MNAVPFQKLFGTTLLVAAALGLAACGSEESPLGTASPSNPSPTAPNEEVQAPVRLLANAANPDFMGMAREFQAPSCSSSAAQPRTGGNSYSVNLQSASGENIAFTVFEPAAFDCQRGNPLVLEGHGYGGSRAISPRGIIDDLVAAGAGVISVDQRGFGESSGSVRVLDPDFEGQDLLQILDWAEANLDWLRYSNKKQAGEREFNMVAGATGGSYGGGYQMLIHNIDPEKRLDALTPDIAWNDLRYSLNPGGAYGIENFEPEAGSVEPVGTVKSGWALLLVAGGEAGSRQNNGQDNLIRETLVRGTTANRFPEGALEFFRYHSPSYWCDAEAPGAQTFLQSEVTPGLAPKTPDPVDILFTQGFRDTLFNFNDALHNFSCYRALEDNKGKKADVRLLTHQSGHILPVSASSQTEQGVQNGLNEIQFQKPGGPFACGDLNIPAAQFAFLIEKLFTPGEVARIKRDSESNAFDLLAANKGNVCLSLNDDVGQGSASDDAAVWVSEETFFAKLVPNSKGQPTNTAIAPIAIDFTPGADPTSVLTSAATGILRYPFAPAVMPIELPAGVNIVAGVPTATLEIAPPVDMVMNPVCSEIYAASAMSPVGLGGLEPGCDPVLFVGLGVNRDGAWRLIDDQVTPIRGFGKRHVELTGVAERLADGESLGLMVYGFHPQYPATGSRDLLTPVVALRGSLNLPAL